MQFRLGKNPPVVDSRTLHFSTYMQAQIPAPPDAKDWGHKVAHWPMYDNDRYGDCTCAAAAHMIQNWTANSGRQANPLPQNVLKFYEHFVGVPGPDAGVNMLDALKYWRNHGLGIHKVMAFTALELRNKVQVKDAIAIFGSAYLGLSLPDFAVMGDALQVPWVVPPHGAVGPDAPNPLHGHCVPAVAYDARGLHVVTWGAVKTMSWQFYSAYADEAYAVLSHDFIKKATDVAASGFNLKTLEEDLAELERTPSRFATISRRPV